MYDIIKEFIAAVGYRAWEECIAVGTRGMEVTLLSMLAFFFIAVGIFIDSRCACVYYVAPGGKKRMLGDVYIKETKGGYTARIPARFLEKSSTIYYYMEIPGAFTGSHYMERLFLDTPMGKQLVPVKKRVHFKIGLGEHLAPVPFS